MLGYSYLWAKMVEYIPLFKAIHLIGMVVWFAGMFYLARIFVYHREAFDTAEPERSILIKQYNIMQWRVYKIICNPGMNITLIFGILMLYAYGMDWLAAQGWLHVKLTFVFLLIGYQHINKSIIKKLEKGSLVMSSERFRLYNEIPSIALLIIILLAVYKNTLNYAKAGIGVVIFIAALIIFTKIYKKIRERKST